MKGADVVPTRSTTGRKPRQMEKPSRKKTRETQAEGEARLSEGAALRAAWKAFRPSKPTATRSRAHNYTAKMRKKGANDAQG